MSFQKGKSLPPGSSTPVRRSNKVRPARMCDVLLYRLNGTPVEAAAGATSSAAAIAGGQQRANGVAFPRNIRGDYGAGGKWNGVGAGVARADKKRNKRHNNGQQNLLVRTIWLLLGATTAGQRRTHRLPLCPGSLKICLVLAEKRKNPKNKGRPITVTTAAAGAAARAATPKAAPAYKYTNLWRKLEKYCQGRGAKDKQVDFKAR